MAPVSTSPIEPAIYLQTTADVSNIKITSIPVYHPLDELTPDEITSISAAIREYGVSKGVKAAKFIVAALVPPPKKDVLAHLGIPLAPGSAPKDAPGQMTRRAEMDFIDMVNGTSYNAQLSLEASKWKVDELTALPEGVQPQITMEELLEAEDIVRKDPTVIKLAADIGLKPEQICADGWSIGYDDRFPKAHRLQQCLLYARFAPDSNLYAHPLDFFPVIDDMTKSVIHIDFPAHYTKPGNKLSSDSTAPPALDTPDHALTRERIAPPLTGAEYLPELMKPEQLLEPDVKAREELKPLHVSQPEGVSFKMNGNEIAWQKWKMHISFNAREGLVLSTVTYTDGGEVRPIMYRMSLAEMVVPYGAPEHPHGRKFAFDVGEYGMGVMANDLTLGCDCLGSIHYLPGCFVGHSGKPTILKRAICIHEEDAGLLWKHTDFRAGGRSLSVRSRKLVISMIATVANYEYMFYWNFYQDGTIELETRLSGILNVYVAGKDETPPYGTLVAPQVQAHYHQHIFSLRLDPMVDGLSNSVVETDIHPLDAPTGSKENFAGNGFVTKKTVLKESSAREYDCELDRRWSIVNPARKHYSSGSPVGYSIGMRGSATRLLAKPDSWVARRAPFATKALWVVKDVENKRVFPAGKYVPQTRESPTDAVDKWVGQDSIDNEDLLLFLTFGTTHVPRPEDWPVMPVEHLRVTLKPNNFFKWSPALDVKAGLDAHSVLSFGTGAVPAEAPRTSSTNGNDTNGTSSHCGCA